MAAELSSAGHAVFALTRHDLDIVDAAQVGEAMASLRPDAIVNCSAYNAVDAAESDVSEAFAINAQGPALLAQAAETLDARFVHYSTDFVFDGTARTPYAEDDPINPLSVYAASKAAGENEARRAPRHHVLRLSSLFGGVGVRGHRSTIDHMIDNLMAGDTVCAVTDRTVSPSWLPEVVRATRLILERDLPPGTYHCVSSGFVTWYNLAHELARQLGVEAEISGISSANITSVARRPTFCALANQKLVSVGIDMPAWQDAISRHLRERDLPVDRGKQPFASRLSSDGVCGPTHRP